MRARGTIATMVLVTGLILGAGGPVTAAPPPGDGPAAAPAALPEGWAVGTGPTGPTLTWRPPVRVPMGDAAVEFFADGRLLGRPRPAADQRSFSLDPAGAWPRDVSSLEVRAGGRRIDTAGAARPSATAQAPSAASAVPAVLPKNPVDPGVKGPYETVTGEYALPGVKLPDFPEKVEMQGVVVAPKGVSGKRPLALFLHGRHATCYLPGDTQVTGEWPCPGGTEPIPSYRGYLQAQRLLASQGYVTVSISANGINGQDWRAADGGGQARSSLVRLHLARWADWTGVERASAPDVVRSAPPADLSKVLLVGHSRGGEGVNRAAIDSLTAPRAAQDGYRGRVRWTIRGTVPIGPTIFGHNPAADVPSVTILPGCDGDVADLQGQIFVDGTRGVSRGAALHSALYVVGANHNYFNTEWTPGQAVAPAEDDFFGAPGDKVCSPEKAKTRLTARQQQNVGATYVAAAARLFVAGDDRVRPLLDGGGVRASSADPARVLSHAVGGNRRALVVPASTTKVSGTGGRLCEQVSSSTRTACLNPSGRTERSPHFVPFTFPDPDRHAVALSWSKPGRPVTVKPAKPVSVKGATSVALRVVVPANSTGTKLDVSVTDTSGRRAKLGTVRVDGLPGTENTTSLWGQEVRVPLKAAGPAKVALSKVAKLELVPRSARGRAWLIDAWGWRAGTPAPKPVALPRIDVGQSSVQEGNSGTRTVQIPVTVSGRGKGQIRLFLTDPATFRTTVKLATVTPATRRINVPIKVTGNRRYGDDLQYDLQAKTVTGTVVGDYNGGLLVRNDDPRPTVTMAPVDASTPEGGALTWRIRLSAVADSFIVVGLPLQTPADGKPELSTTDVDPRWLREQFFIEPLPSRPLSGEQIALSADLPPGTREVKVSVPTVRDSLVEPAEHIQLQLTIIPNDGGEPIPGPVFTGTVTNTP